MARNRTSLLFVAFVLFFAPNSLWAVCTSPSGEAGQILFDASDFKFCDGTNWTLLSSLSGGGGGSDDMGNHTASQNIVLDNNWLSNDGGNEGIRVSNTGHIGINESNPQGPLHISAGSDRVHIEVSSAGVLSPFNMWNSNTGASAGTGMLFSAGAISGYIGGVGAARIDAANNSRLAFRVRSNGSLTGLDSAGIFYIEGNSSTPRIVANGNFGVNNTAPNADLDVTGDIEYSGTLTDTSDRRLKHDIQSLENALGILSQVSSVSFRMNENPDRIEFGVIAQDIEPFLPELVRTADDKMKTKSVNYVGFIAWLIQGINELDQKLEKEQIRNDKLEDELRNQQIEIENLKSELLKIQKAISVK